MTREIWDSLAFSVSLCIWIMTTLSFQHILSSFFVFYIKVPAMHDPIPSIINITNKTLWERIFGRGRTGRVILWTCLIAAKQLSSYLTREDKSFAVFVCWTTQLIQYVPIHNNNPVISWQCLKICTSSMPTCLEPNCNIRHKWLQPRE